MAVGTGYVAVGTAYVVASWRSAPVAVGTAYAAVAAAYVFAQLPQSSHAGGSRYDCRTVVQKSFKSGHRGGTAERAGCEHSTHACKNMLLLPARMCVFLVQASPGLIALVAALRSTALHLVRYHGYGVPTGD